MDPPAQPSSPTATRAAGPAPHPLSSSRWVESGVLETLYDAQYDRTPMESMGGDSGARAKEAEANFSSGSPLMSVLVSDSQDSSARHSGGRDMSGSQSGSTSSRYRRDSLREDGVERSYENLGLPAGVSAPPHSS
ncbi:hypothetical protein CF336_g9022 [Tilletia laevis]|nr:hypothetical protein CF336_g9022 [Tilletia laevis]